MTLQKIKSIQGKDEYVLLPMAIYRVLKDQIEKELAACEANQDEVYEPFVLEDYVDNPVALARIKAGITQEQLAQCLGVSQAYISQIERRDTVTNKMLERVHSAIQGAA
ncbi:MAG: helix-turn-helix domain-containing protein [Nitrosomonas sp.]|uniref:helix-turn-helix domain-containing protein n=1 Tax=Nitrosomonas sp. TaxID=42353 RepID=UPI0025D6AD62|nr:helix-turn-helix transcriptional regulator [Nitrosomonas sp.]UJP01798.1 MAG: helix-turn-helix domain-containing protein [Nitrosomonas sp.]